MTTKLSQVAQGVTPEEMIDLLGNAKNSNDSRTKYTILENLRSRVQSPEHSSKIGELLGATQIPDAFGGDIAVSDPISGNPYPNTDKLIDDYIQTLKAENQTMSNTTFNFSKFSQNGGKRVKKKDSRGNPFRVLMGQIGKLMDHGLEKRDIVRYIMKSNIWNKETIEKAVGVVKEYNKKKHRKHDGKDKKKAEAQTLMAEAPEMERGTPDYSKRSTPELVTSICWLNSLSKQKEVEDRSGVKTMIREIRSELSSRGMSEETLNAIL